MNRRATDHRGSTRQSRSGTPPGDDMRRHSKACWAIPLVCVATLVSLVYAPGLADGAWICETGCDGGVIEIIDGNTLKIQTREFGPINIDLALVITPELNQKGGAEAHNFLRSACRPAERISYDLDLMQSDDSMRKLIAEVWCRGQSVNEILIKNKHATLDINKCDVTDFWNRGWAAECKSGIWGNAQKISDIECSDSKILLESPRGRPVCVEQMSVDQFIERGFKIVNTASINDINVNTMEETNYIQITFDTILITLITIGAVMSILIIAVILLILKSNRKQKVTIKKINKNISGSLETNNDQMQNTLTRHQANSIEESRQGAPIISRQSKNFDKQRQPDIIPKEKHPMAFAKESVSLDLQQNKPKSNIKKTGSPSAKMKSPIVHMDERRSSDKKSHIPGDSGIMPIHGGADHSIQKSSLAINSGSIMKEYENEEKISNNNKWLNLYVEYVDELIKHYKELMEKYKESNEKELEEEAKGIMDQLKMQKNALERTYEMDEMININEKSENLNWKFTDQPMDKWNYIGEDMHGYKEQRRFVKIALSTPDFAILEGPPGSGKTTVICELITQLEKEEKSVLICSSTHVAVNNILEKLVGDSLNRKGKIFRTGRGRSKISGKALEYTLDGIGRDLYPDLELGSDQKINPSSDEKSQIDKTISEINLVFGTTMSIANYIKKYEKHFDVMIIDEASKTTFQEFVVPAIHANKWIIVGDIMQLSPYANTEDVGKVVEIKMLNKHPEVCINTLNGKKRPQIIEVESDDDEIIELYKKQCRKVGVKFYGMSNAPIKIKRHGIILTVPETDQNITKHNINYTKIPELQKRWIQGVGYRLKLAYEQAIVSKNNPLDSEYMEQIKQITLAGNEDRMLEEAHNVMSIAFPSVMELLLHGNICRPDVGSNNSIFVNSIPKGLREHRRVLLKYQFRMHPDIAEFAKDCFYEGKALKSMEDFERMRELYYGLFEKRLCWIKVEHNLSEEINKDEIDRIFLQLKHFHELEIEKGEDEKWEIGILSFYKKQNEAIQKRLDKEDGYSGMEITNGTVDSFQGKEFDIVLVSFSKSKPTPFLNSPNRLNVAITRARYLCILVGDPKLLCIAKQKDKNSPLAQLDKIEKYTGMADYHDLFKNGCLAAEARKFKVATGWFDRALDKKPDDCNALYRKGMLLVEQGQNEEAFDYFDGMQDKGGRAPLRKALIGKALVGKGVMLAKLGYHRKAISYYDRALKIDPGDSDAQESKDASHGYLEKYDGTKRGDLYKMIVTEPDPSLLFHGRRLSEGMDDGEAAALCKKELEKNPNDILSLYDKGCLFVASGGRKDFELALDYFKRVMELDPDDMHALHNKGSLLVKMNHYEDALACFEEVLKREPGDYQTLFCKGYVLDRLERRKEAVECFEKVLEVVPNNPEVLDKNGHALARLGRYKKALICFEKLCKERPKDRRHRDHKAIMLVEMDRIREAIKCIGQEPYIE
ncbi:MAG: AAA domain-containing protein [Nitrosopumilus sp.]|nr:AAA domain-containing protein [Nitrosopumilus sp.]